MRFRALLAQTIVSSITTAVRCCDLITFRKAFFASFVEDHRLNVGCLNTVQIPVRDDPWLGPGSLSARTRTITSTGADVVHVLEPIAHVV